MTDVATSPVIFRENGVEITEEQKQTFASMIEAQEPTEDEINLHFHFCAMRGVHPLLNLIYFTKRSGKYTPVTSIDFMRQRADSSGVYAGSDDAVYGKRVKIGTKEYPTSATVTVWKMVEHTLCKFTATALWEEYAPSNLGSPAAFMWRSKPHVMIAKCAEALALRKGFPGQLQSLYTAEELDANVVTVDVSQRKPVTKALGEKYEERNPASEEDVVEETEQKTADDPVMITWFNGQEKVADDMLDILNINNIRARFVGAGKMFENPAALRKHLVEIFKITTLQDMTWAQAYAFIKHCKGEGDDPKWYAPAKEEKPEEAFDKDIDKTSSVDLDALAQAWKGTQENPVKYTELKDEERKRIEDMLELVQAGMIQPDDIDGMVEVLKA